MSSSRARAHTWPYPRQRYFEQQMRNVAANWFAARGCRTHARYPYILAQADDWARNIILPEVAEYIRAERARRESLGQGFPLHKYIHHGLSSQALVFNLVGPLIVCDDLEPLRMVFESHGVVWPEGRITASFEHENRTVFHEDTGQPTALDIVVTEETSGPFLFIEAKFVEKGFGGCSVASQGDCDGRNPAQDFSLCYLHHLGRRYWDLLRKHGFLVGPLAQDTTCILASHYQFFREVLFALESNGAFVLLADTRNPAFYAIGPDQPRGLLPFLTSLIPAAVRHHIIFVPVQQVVAAIEQIGRHAWVGEFKEKYGLG